MVQWSTFTSMCCVRLCTLFISLYLPSLLKIAYIIFDNGCVFPLAGLLRLWHLYFLEKHGDVYGIWFRFLFNYKIFSHPFDYQISTFVFTCGIDGSTLVSDCVIKRCLSSLPDHQLVAIKTSCIFLVQNDLVHGWGLDFALRRCVEVIYHPLLSV